MFLERTLHGSFSSLKLVPHQHTDMFYIVTHGVIRGQSLAYSTANTVILPLADIQRCQFTLYVQSSA